MDGRRMGKHNREMCLALGLAEIPDGFVVHHLDRNKHNNGIHNLALVSITGHNRIHSHAPWNLGLTRKDPKWNATHIKAQETRFKRFLPKFKDAFEYQLAGYTLKEIAERQGISRRQVSDRIKRYKQYLNQ